MKREWVFGGGAAAVALSLVLITGVVRVEVVERETPEPPTVSESADEPEVSDRDAVARPLRLVPAEPDPAYDWLRERSLQLVSGYLGSAAPDSTVARWHDASTHESRLIFASPEGDRIITLAAARADCRKVDAFLREAGDPLVGLPGLCERWISTARKLLRERGVRGSASGFLRQQGVDTSVRVALVYAGWKRTGPGPQDFRLVQSRGVGVYPQSEFSVARRLALDRVMRDLGVGPYSDTPIQLVTALLRW